MSPSAQGLRYDAAQIVAAVDRARGDGRYHLVLALCALPTGQREDALAQVLDKELRPVERQIALAELARLRPSRYLAPLIETGLRSPSIDVQQMAVAVLPEVVGEGLAPELSEQLEGWLRRRLENPRRESTWAMWEIPGVALTLLPSYGAGRVAALLSEIAPRLQPEESERWRSLRGVVNDVTRFRHGLTDWMNENCWVSDPDRRDPRDPTAEVSVDRVMKRLGYEPANAESRVYDSLAGSTVPTIVTHVGDDERSAHDD